MYLKTLNIQVAALFGVLGSGLGAAGTGVGLAAVNGAFGDIRLIS